MRKYIAVDYLLAALNSLSPFIEKNFRMFGGRYLPIPWSSGRHYLPGSRMFGGRSSLWEDILGSSEIVYMVSWTLC